LRTFESRLKARAQVLAGSHHWLELDNSPTGQYVAIFDRPKIIYPNMTNFLPFIFDKGYIYAHAKCYLMTGESLQYLTAIFNSRLFKFCFMDEFPTLGEDRRELQKRCFEKIPIKKANAVEQQCFEELVDQIIESEKQNPNTDTTQLEATID